MDFTVQRLGPDDIEIARETFARMTAVFDEPAQFLSDDYLAKLLHDHRFIALAAVQGDEVVGGLTGHVLPMTRTEVNEVLLYDIAVDPEHQRKGVGRKLLRALQATAAGEGLGAVFVLADAEDSDALDFYRRCGGRPSSVMLFDLPVA